MAAIFEYLDPEQFHPRLGVWAEEMRALLNQWPDLDDSSDDGSATLAINNSLNDLLHGVGISDSEAIALTGVDRKEMYRIYKKWATAKG